MTQHEFETLIGTEVTNETFEYANRVYMAAGEMSKDNFCKDWRNKFVRESRVVSCLTSEVETLQGAIKNYDRQIKAQAECLSRFTDEMVDFLVLQAEKWSASDLREKAIKMVGIQEYLRLRLEFGFGLWEDDRKALIAILNND